MIWMVAEAEVACKTADGAVDGEGITTEYPRDCLGVFSRNPVDSSMNRKS